MFSRLPRLLPALAVTAAGVLLLATGTTAQQPAAQPPDLKAKQEENQKLFKDFTDSLVRLANRLEKSDRPEDKEKAKTITRAIELASKENVSGRFSKLVQGLAKGKTEFDLSGLRDDEKDLRVMLKKIYEILVTDDESAARKAEIAKLEAILKQVKELQRVQRVIQGVTESKSGDPKKIAKSQDDAAKRTEDIVKQSGDKQGDGQGKPGTQKDDRAEAKPEAKPGDAPGEGKGETAEAKGEGKDGMGKDGEGKGMGEGKPMDGMGEGKGSGDAKEGMGKEGMGGEGKGMGDPKEGKPGEGQPGEGKPMGKPGEGKPGEGKPGEGKPGEGKPGEGKPMGKPGEGKPGEGKPGEGKPGEGKPGEGKPGAGKPGEGKPGEGKGKGEGKGEGKPGDAKAGEGKGSGKGMGQGQGQGQGQGKPGGGQGQQPPPPPGGQQPPPPPQNQTPGRKELEEAIPHQQDAAKKVGDDNRKEASKGQDKALDKIAQAIAELEKRLKQLREEETKKLLAALEARVNKMLVMQIEVYEATKAIDGNIQKATGEIGVADRQKSLQQSDKEGEIVAEADRTLKLMENEGSAVAFATVLIEVRQDMVAVQRRLSQVYVNKPTQVIEEQIIAMLKDMAEALKKAQQDPPPPAPPKPGQPPKPANKKLLDLIAELKLIRALQKQVNERTKMYGQQEKNIVQSKDPIIQAELKMLAAKQAKLEAMIDKIATRADDE